MVGDLGIGAHHPIRLQTMTTTDTLDTAATVEQCIRCIHAGSELVRITAPSVREAEHLAVIKKELRDRGYTTPLVADIHYTPNAAYIAARIVEKVRINPGNFADKKKAEPLDLSDEQYRRELDRIRDRFVPLIRICKQYGTALRIGTNHGSLSDRIMSRYGDNPLGMVESALEYVQIAEDESFYNIILSMKASNPQIMVQAYRLLVQRMIETGRNYPIHLGVTEAGDGEDGRIKSAIGIGTLLAEGIGDTVRVSLTEPPEAEIPVARKLVELFRHANSQHSGLLSAPYLKEESPRSPFEYHRPSSHSVLIVGGNQVPIVVADLGKTVLHGPQVLNEVGWYYDTASDKWTQSDQAADMVYIGAQEVPFPLPASLWVIQDFATWKKPAALPNTLPLLTIKDFMAEELPDQPFVLSMHPNELLPSVCQRLQSCRQVILTLFSPDPIPIWNLRRAFYTLHSFGIAQPVVLRLTFSKLPYETFLLKAASDAGALLIDGWGQGLWLTAHEQVPHLVNRTAFAILQGCRLRLSRTEYISCPSCGRTLFDLMETTARIRARTSHLKGIKIAVMGCIVNGPGEMADADYGYVGSGPGKITLFKGKEIVKRNVDTEHAVDELIALIKDCGDWIEAPASHQTNVPLMPSGT